MLGRATLRRRFTPRSPGAGLEQERRASSFGSWEANTSFYWASLQTGIPPQSFIVLFRGAWVDTDSRHFTGSSYIYAEGCAAFGVYFGRVRKYFISFYLRRKKMLIC